MIEKKKQKLVEAFHRAVRRIYPVPLSITTAGREVGSIANREKEKDEKEIASCRRSDNSCASVSVVDLRQRSNKGFKANEHDRARNDNVDVDVDGYM